MNRSRSSVISGIRVGHLHLYRDSIQSPLPSDPPLRHLSRLLVIELLCLWSLHIVIFLVILLTYDLISVLTFLILPTTSLLRQDPLPTKARLSHRATTKMASEQGLPTSDIRAAHQDYKRDAEHKHKWAHGTLSTRGRGLDGHPRPMRVSDRGYVLPVRPALLLP